MLSNKFFKITNLLQKKESVELGKLIRLTKDLTFLQKWFIFDPQLVQIFFTNNFFESYYGAQSRK